MYFFQLLVLYFSAFFHSSAPDWVKAQIRKDLEPFKESKISLEEMENTFRDKNSFFIKMQLINNQLYYFCDNEVKKHGLFAHRFPPIKQAIKELSKKYRLPNITFFLTLHDGWTEDTMYPLFTMSKKKDCKGPVLFPDFFALSNGFQILAGKDLRTFSIPWETKQNRLIWRGVTTQAFYSLDNFQNIPRVILCHLSQKFPELIDAKFTKLDQGAENIDACKQYLGDKIPYEEIISYKYQMWIDGNAVSYSESGWRFFTHSVIFKPDSENVQWYFGEIKPWVHYVPVKANLEDLVEKISYIKNNDAFALELAQNVHNFALECIPREKCLDYLYHLLMAYSKLKFEK